MGNPTSIQDIIKVNATISGSGGGSRQVFSDPAFVSTFDDSVDFPDKIRRYVGTLSEMQASLVADGFSANDAAYRQITAAKVQQQPPDVIYIGRADPADLTYADSLTAIWNEAESNDFSLYFLSVDERSPSQIEAIADWTAQRTFVLYMAATASLTVYNDDPGNVCRNIITKGYDTTALIWHDSATASKYGPATLTSARGPFRLPAVSGTFQVRINDGALQTFTLTANPTTTTGTNAGPFVIANGDAFSITIDDGVLQTVAAVLLPASVTSADEFYNVPPNSVLQVSFNGLAAVSSTFTATQGDVTTSDEVYAFAPASSVTFDIDGSGNQVIALAVTDTTRALVKTKLDALTGATVIDTGSSLIIRSDTYGTASDVEIVAGTGNALTELGLVVSNNTGSGFAANLAVATAAELQTKLATDFAASAAVVVDGSAVRMDTLKIGKAATVRVLDGIANDAIGFSTSEFRGDGDFNDGAAVATNEVVSWIAEKFNSFTSANDGGDFLVLTTRSRGSQSKITVGASTLATTFGFAPGVVVNVGSNVGNADNVFASEISSVVSGTLNNGTTAAASSKFTISSLGNGTSEKVELVGGSYADLLFGATALTVLGTGTDEDYIDCAYVGRLATLRLDEPNGQSTWDDAPLIGIFPDKIDPGTRKTLHETLKVNTYERRLGRNEMHFGTVVWGTTSELYRYIDQRVSLDWVWARSVETFKTTLNRLADAKKKAPNTDDGIQILANDWTRFLATGEVNGHYIYDDTPITSETDTGITIPTRAQQSNTNVSLRKVSGFAVRFQFLDAIHRAEADVNLTSFAEITVAA